MLARAKSGGGELCFPAVVPPPAPRAAANQGPRLWRAANEQVCGCWGFFSCFFFRDFSFDVIGQARKQNKRFTDELDQSAGINEPCSLTSGFKMLPNA